MVAGTACVRAVDPVWLSGLADTDLGGEVPCQGAATPVYVCPQGAPHHADDRSFPVGTVFIVESEPIRQIPRISLHRILSWKMRRHDAGGAAAGSLNPGCMPVGIPAASRRERIPGGVASAVCRGSPGLCLTIGGQTRRLDCADHAVSSDGEAYAHTLPSPPFLSGDVSHTTISLNTVYKML